LPELKLESIIGKPANIELAHFVLEECFGVIFAICGRPHAVKITGLVNVPKKVFDILKFRSIIPP
jgi:hypothetical protein